MSDTIVINYSGDFVIGQFIAVERRSADFEGVKTEHVLFWVQEPEKDAPTGLRTKYDPDSKKKTTFKKFVASYNTVTNTKILSTDEMLQKFVKIQITPREAMFKDGRKAEWEEYAVIGIYGAKEDMEEDFHKVNVTPAPDDEENMPFVPTSEKNKVTEPVVEVPNDVATIMKQMYEAAGKDVDKFWAQVEPFKFSKEAVFKAVGIEVK